MTYEYDHTPHHIITLPTANKICILGSYLPFDILLHITTRQHHTCITITQHVTITSPSPRIITITNCLICTHVAPVNYYHTWYTYTHHYHTLPSYLYITFPISHTNTSTHHLTFNMTWLMTIDHVLSSLHKTTIGNNNKRSLSTWDSQQLFYLKFYLLLMIVWQMMPKSVQV